MPQAAAVCGVAYDTLLSYLNSSDPPPRLPNKKFRSDELGAWIRRQAFSGIDLLEPNEPDRINGSYERARKDKETADKLQLENQVRRGELLEATEVEAMWSMILMRVRTRIQTIPSTIAPLVAAENEPGDCHKILDQQCREALDELSRGWDVEL